MDAKARFKELPGDDPASAVLELKRCASECHANQKRHASWKSEWTKYQADESLWLSMLSFVPAVAHKRLAKARVALEGIGCTIDTHGLESVSDITLMLQDGLRLATTAAKTAETEYQTARKALWNASEDVTEAEQEWQDWIQTVEDFGAPDVSASDIVELDRLADRSLRFRHLPDGLPLLGGALAARHGTGHR